MDFFNIGTGELLVLGLLAIALFGPEDMVKMARTLGRYARIARESWMAFSRQLDREISLADQQQRAEALDKLLRGTVEAEAKLGANDRPSPPPPAEEPLER